MRKFLGILIAAVFMATMAGTAMAAVTDTLTVTVLVRYLSLLVDAADDPYDFGQVDQASQTVSTSSITVTNDGNVAEDFQLQIEAAGLPADMSIEEGAGAPGADAFKLYSMFDNDGLLSGVAIAAGDFDENDLILNSGARRCDSFHDSGDDDANDVASSGTVEMWLMFYAPASMTSGYGQQTIVVTLTALAG